MVTREDLVRELVRLAAIEGPGVTLWRFEAATGINAMMVRRRWGGMAQLRAAAGLPEQIRRGVVYTDEELFEELSRVGELCGEFPSVAAFERLAAYSWMTLSRRFGRREVVWARYREWLEQQPIEGRPGYLRGLPLETPSAIPGVIRHGRTVGVGGEG